jgi:Na+-translocating ferredoxin:NAD+ oxidoreductase RnfG subunit
VKSSFSFVALPVAALIAPSAFAVQYLSVEQAQQAIFPGKTFAPASIKLTPAQRSAIQKRSRVRVLHDEQRVWRVSGGGWFIVDEVVGKHDYITYAVGLNADGSVRQIEVMEYRETYGYEIRNEKWRAQFVGKTASSTLKLDDDIKNISGATLSCRHVTDGVKRLLAFYEVALR